MAKTARKKPTTPGRCPICGKPASERHLPFCSARCTNVDLGRWLGGNYRVVTDEAPETDPDGAGER